ncbi:MAG: hypothetical protein V4548_06730 [Bacteroidota bacterium]
MTNFSKIALCAMVITAGVFTSCSKDDDAPAEASIYKRLGGTTMVQDPTAAAGVKIEQGRLSYRSVVDSTVVYIVADIVAGNTGNLGAHFAPLAGEVFGTPANTTNLAKLSDNLTDFFSFNTGGTNAVNTYSGLDMVAAHNPAVNVRMGAKSTEADYTRFEGFVGAAANANGVATGTDLYNDVVAVLESLRAPIVQ